MGRMEYLRICSDQDGCSHFEMCNIAMESNNYAPPAPPLYTSSPESSNSCLFLELPVGWHGDWHPTPVLQWLILMTGELEFESGDGERQISKAGDAVLLADLTGKGHKTRVLGNSSVRIAAVHIS